MSYAAVSGSLGLIYERLKHPSRHCRNTQSPQASEHIAGKRPPPNLALQRPFLLQPRSPLVRCLTWTYRNPPSCSSTQTLRLAHEDEAEACCPPQLPLHLLTSFSLMYLEMCCIVLPSTRTPERDCSQAKHSPPSSATTSWGPHLPPASPRPPLPGATGQRLT